MSIWDIYSILVTISCYLLKKNVWINEFNDESLILKKKRTQDTIAQTLLLCRNEMLEDVSIIKWQKQDSQCRCPQKIAGGMRHIVSLRDRDRKEPTANFKRNGFAKWKKEKKIPIQKNQFWSNLTVPYHRHLYRSKLASILLF